MASAEVGAAAEVRRASSPRAPADHRSAVSPSGRDHRGRAGGGSYASHDCVRARGVLPRCTYVRYDDVEGTYFPAPFLTEGTLCWVLKSKGGGGRGGNKDSIEVDDGGRGGAAEDVGDRFDGECGDRGRGGGGGAELFLRARVVSDPSDVDAPPSASAADRRRRRVLVRYPLGSTYRVRRRNLLPVLEPSEGRGGAVVVIVTSETSDYRRCAAVHVCPGESFLEIGCAFGTTVDRVRRCLTEFGGGLPPSYPNCGGVPASPSPLCAGEEDENVEEGGDGDATWRCGVGAAEAAGPVDRAKDVVVAIGVDKSIESISIARSRHPRCLFRHVDVLTNDGFDELRATCRDELAGGWPPDVVSIDINGNRDLPAVMECVRLITGVGDGDGDDDDDDGVGPRSAFTGETLPWRRRTMPPPRLVIVKSRALHAVLSSRRGANEAGNANDAAE